MSAGKLTGFLANSFSLAIGGAIGWLLIAPIALLTPRRRDLLVVMGMGGGKFIDNAKYFFLQGGPLLHPAVHVIFLTEQDDIAGLLEENGLAVARYPSWRAIRLLLRCGVAVVDSGDWLFRMRRFLLAGASIVQLWHGVGFKRVGLDKMRNEPRRWLSSPLMMWLRMLNGALNGKLVHYSAMLSPSRFYEREVFRPSIPARHYLIAGYPRNTFGEANDETRRLAWLNVDGDVSRSLHSWLERGRRLVLIAPTFRDSRPTALGLDASTVATLDAWCEFRGAELVFKFHPFEQGTAQVTGRHLHLCDPISDLYPLMPLSHALVTDYSSIYMDYLLLDKPVLFFVPDLQEYVRQDRQFQFDFDEMTPGPKLDTWQQVLDTLDNEWRKDGFAAERARLKQLAFDGLDQREAVPKLIAFMRTQGWIR